VPSRDKTVRELPPVSAGEDVVSAPNRAERRRLFPIPPTGKRLRTGYQAKAKGVCVTTETTTMQIKHEKPTTATKLGDGPTPTNHVIEAGEIIESPRCLIEKWLAAGVITDAEIGAIVERQRAELVTDTVVLCRAIDLRDSLQDAAAYAGSNGFDAKAWGTGPIAEAVCEMGIAVQRAVDAFDLATTSTEERAARAARLAADLAAVGDGSEEIPF
jgi:hypothetical protein